MNENEERACETAPCFSLPWRSRGSLGAASALRRAASSASAIVFCTSARETALTSMGGACCDDTAPAWWAEFEGAASAAATGSAVGLAQRVRTYEIECECKCRNVPLYPAKCSRKSKRIGSRRVESSAPGAPRVVVVDHDAFGAQHWRRGSRRRALTHELSRVAAQIGCWRCHDGVLRLVGSGRVCIGRCVAGSAARVGRGI